MMAQADKGDTAGREDKAYSSGCTGRSSSSKKAGSTF
jgi:hypothetical protein